MKDEKRQVLGYLRVSTDGQVGEDKFGLDNQESIIREYCDRKGYEVVKWYKDEGQSGVKERRPGLDELLYGNCEWEEWICPSGVVVAKSDRMARDIKLYYYYMYVLKKKGLELISATEEVVNDDSGLGDIYKSLMLFVAEQERQNITKRTAGGRKQKALSGGWAGGRVPFGYRKTVNGLEVDNFEAICVRCAFMLRGRGLGYKKILRELNLAGFHTQKEKALSLSTLKIILNNEKFYKGWYRYGDGEWVEGQHQPILTRKDTEQGYGKNKREPYLPRFIQGYPKSNKGRCLKRAPFVAWDEQKDEEENRKIFGDGGNGAEGTV